MSIVCIQPSETTVAQTILSRFGGKQSAYQRGPLITPYYNVAVNMTIFVDEVELIL